MSPDRVCRLTTHVIC